MTKEDLEDFDFASAVTGVATREGQKLPGRRVADKKKISETDRRRIRATGRTEQMNLRTRPEWKREVFNDAARIGIQPIEMLELAWQHYKAWKGAE